MLTARIWWNWHGCRGYTEHIYGGNWFDDDSDEELFAGQLYWWTDGNFGCDCNRGDVVDLPVDTGCGDNIIFEYVMLYRDGRCIGIFWDDMQIGEGANAY